MAVDNITIDTSSVDGKGSGDGGNVRFTDKLDSVTGQAYALTITTKAGTVQVDDIIGSTTALGALTINNNATDTGTITLNGIGDGTDPALGSADVLIGSTGTTGMTLKGAFYDTGAATYTTDGADITVQRATAGTTEFGLSNEAAKFVGGNIKLADGTDLSIVTGSAVLEVVGVRGHSGEDVTLDTTTGIITIGTGGIGSSNEINDVILSGPTKLTGNITTDATDGDVRVDGALTLLANSTINTAAGDGSIDLDSTVDGTYDLILTSGAGQIDIDGAIGAGTVLKSLTINAQNSETSSGKIILNNIGATGAGNGGVKAAGATKIGNAATTEIEFKGSIYNTEDTQTYTSKANTGSGLGSGTDGNGNFDVTVDLSLIHI